MTYVLPVQAMIVAQVVADSALGPLIGDRIYDEKPDHVVAVDALDDVSDVTATAFPACIVIGPIFEEPFDMMGGGPEGSQINVDLITYSRGTGSVECKQIAEALVDLFHRSQHALSLGQMCWGWHENTSYDVRGDGRTYIAISEFRFNVRAT